MKKIIFVIKDYEDETIVKDMEVKKYYDLGRYYEVIFDDGYGCMPKERVIRIEEYGKEEK